VALRTRRHFERKEPERNMNIMLYGSLSIENEIWEMGEYLHEGMWEAHFAAVDDAVAHAFDKGEDVVVFGVENDALERGFDGV
jgi:hypothetical protein